MWSSPMLRTTGMSPRCGRTRLRRKAEIANKTAVPIVDRSAIAHIGDRSCRIALITGQLVPQATAMAARRAIASRRRNGEGPIPLKTELYQPAVVLTRLGFPNQLQHDSRWQTEGRLPWGLPLRYGRTIPAKSFAGWQAE